MQFIEIVSDGPVTTIILDRPAAMNAIHPEMHFELQDAFDNFAADPAQRICVVTGRGERAFCAGSDLKLASQHRGYPRCGYAGLIDRFDLNKPVIAAVNGLALGGGFEIVLACDIVVAADHARFGLPEPLVGAVALGGGLHRLARQIGLKPAMGMILSARQVGAEAGLGLGFVNQVVPADQLSSAVASWCDDILRGSPMALAASKEAVLRGLDEPSLAAAMRDQGNHPAYAAWRDSADAKEGPRAFAEKRKPSWAVR